MLLLPFSTSQNTMTHPRPELSFPLHFPIVAPPKYPFLSQISSILTGLSFIFGIGVVFLLVYLSLGDFFEFLIPKERTPEEEMQRRVILGGFLVALALFGYAFYAIRERRKVPAGKLYDYIGMVTLHQDRIEVNLPKSTSHTLKWTEISRLDCFYGMGVKTQLSEDDDAFAQIEVIRLWIRSPKVEINEYVLNSEEGSDQYGMLYHAINRIKSQDMATFKKIQLYGQF